MRTDTQRLDWLLTIIERQDEEAADRLTAAHTLELRGRPMLDAAMGAKIVEPGEPMPALTAIDLAIAELGRIRNVKGFSEEQDDLHVFNTLAEAAASYLLIGRRTEWSDAAAHEWWPWPEECFKPSPDDRKKELTKSIALALCELDRLIRAERREDEAADAEVPKSREFKVGDRVRIASNAKDNPWGWCAQMDEYVGRLDEIARIVDEETDEPGYEVGGLTYPASQLEHVDD